MRRKVFETKIIKMPLICCLLIILWGCDFVEDATFVKSEKDALKYAEIARNSGEFLKIDKTVEQDIIRNADGSATSYSYIIRYTIDGNPFYSVCVDFGGKVTVHDADIKNCPIPK